MVITIFLDLLIWSLSWWKNIECIYLKDEIWWKNHYLNNVTSLGMALGLLRMLIGKQSCALQTLSTPSLKNLLLLDQFWRMPSFSTPALPDLYLSRKMVTTLIPQSCSFHHHPPSTWSYLWTLSWQILRRCGQNCQYSWNPSTFLLRSIMVELIRRLCWREIRFWKIDSTQKFFKFFRLTLYFRVWNSLRSWFLPVSSCMSPSWRPSEMWWTSAWRWLWQRTGRLLSPTSLPF